MYVDLICKTTGKEEKIIMLTDGIKIEVYMRFSKQINVMCETCAKVF